MTEGLRVARGDPVGEVGDTGRASACHLHFAISPACLATEWWVRRGAIWPQPYLESWRSGGNLSPVDEVNAFMAEHPSCVRRPGGDAVGLRLSQRFQGAVGDTAPSPPVSTS